MERILQNGLVISVEQQRDKDRNVVNFGPDCDILGLCYFVDFLCCAQVLMCCCTFVCGVFSSGKTGPSSGWCLPPIKYNETLPSV